MTYSFQDIEFVARLLSFAGSLFCQETDATYIPLQLIVSSICSATKRNDNSLASRSHHFLNEDLQFIL